MIPKTLQEFIQYKAEALPVFAPNPCHDVMYIPTMTEEELKEMRRFYKQYEELKALDPVLFYHRVQELLFHNLNGATGKLGYIS